MEISTQDRMKVTGCNINKISLFFYNHRISNLHSNITCTPMKFYHSCHNIQEEWCCFSVMCDMLGPYFFLPPSFNSQPILP